MLKEAEQAGRKQIHLLYMDSKGTFLYKKELDEIAENTTIGVTYCQSREEFYAEMGDFIKEYQNAGMYYLGGSKSMIASVETYLKNRRISKENIKKDVFFGIN